MNALTTTGDCNILFCTLGHTWAVVPEVYSFLALEQAPLFAHHPDKPKLSKMLAEFGLQPPAEIWICTTRGDQTRRGIELLLQWRAHLRQPPTLRIWEAEGTRDLVTREECENLRELLLRIRLLSHEDAGAGQVVLSLAGGRKTMSADLQWAGHVFGCHGFIHVVAQEPLPDALRQPTPELLARPLPVELCRSIAPFVMGRSPRSELLDLDSDGQGPICSSRFPLPLPPDNGVTSWTAPPGPRLAGEIQTRESAGSRLLANYMFELTNRERHENWRGLYRLPPRTIQALRATLIDESWREWVRVLPKADLHRHLGGCLDLPGQRHVGRAVWENMTPAQRDAARDHVATLLGDPDPWPSDWPRRLKSQPIPRAHLVAALLVEADDACLERNLYGVTAPRVALKTRHPLGFAAYERPGELSGSGLLSHPAAIRPYAERVVHQAVEEGLSYLELRGSPQKYGPGSAIDFLRAFRAAVQDTLAQLSPERSPLIRFLMILDRRDRHRLCEVIGQAVQAKLDMPDFVVGLDLAGDEGTARPQDIAHHFLPAFEICLPITIHAGEGESADSIWQAAYHLHADRIGHGLSIGEHGQLAARFRDRSICLELCPASNREVVGFRDPAVAQSADCADYPLPTLWQMGLPLTVCTDNPGISRTTLADEYLAAARMAPGGLHCWEMLAMVKQAFLHAFLPSQEKEALIKRIDSRVFHAVITRFPE